MDTFDVETCQRKLTEHYQKTAKVPTTVWSSVFQVDLEQIYTRLSWVKEKHTLTGSLQSELSHYTDLFTEKTENGAVPKRILVQGETGIGKSTFVKKLLVDWSNLIGAKVKDAKEQEDELNKSNGDRVMFIKDSEDGVNLEEAKMEEERKDTLRKFELLVSINLKEVSKCKTLTEVMICSRLFPEDDETSADELLSYIHKNQGKVLFVFDGYDEYRTGSEAEENYRSRSNQPSPIYEIFHRNILRDCTVLVTTRSSSADEIRGLADIQVKITGFNMSDRQDFMRKMLENQAQVADLLDFLWKSNMEDLARVPLLNLFFCLLWKEEKEKLMKFIGSKTNLFRAILKHILQHSHSKHSPHISKVKEENYKEILAEIGKVALAGLIKGDLMFEFGQLPEKVRGEESIIVGLFQLSEYGPNLEPMEMVSFIHKSIQEYLAAWYITYKCVPEGNLGGIEQHACTLEDCKALDNVFHFVCGLSDDGAMAVFQHLKSVRISDPTLDLSKTKPDVENETDIPLCDVTDQFRRFSGLVCHSFREVHSKAELLSHFFDCTGGIVLVSCFTPLCELIPEVSIPPKLAQNCVFVLSEVGFGDYGEYLVRKSMELLNCLQMPLTIPECSKVLTVGDLVRDRTVCCFFRPCSFSSILCFRDGKFQFYITELFLQCDGHARLFTESSTDPSVVSSLYPEQSCLKFLSSLHFFNLSGQRVKTLGAIIRNCKYLNRIEAEKSDDSVCHLLEQVPNPSKCSLMIGSNLSCDDFHKVNVNVHLTSAGAVQLASLLPRFNVIALDLDLTDCCSEDVGKLITSITHKTLERLVLSGISLTSAAATALGRSLPEMLSLQVLELTGVDDGRILQAEEMKALFGGFNKTLPLSKLTFSGFNVRGCLAPLTKSFCFFPNLTEITLENLNMDGDDQCGLLESLTFIRNLTGLNIQGKQLHQPRFNLSIINKVNLEGLSLTPAAAAALGRSLPEMWSLQELELTGVNGSILQTKEVEVLFGGFYKTMPLQTLILNGFTVRGCIASLIKNLCFFPNLTTLRLDELNMDEHDQCRLLESLRFISDITHLRIQSKPLGHAANCKFWLTSYGFPHITSKSLNLEGISLTPAAATSLGRSLPEMLSLQLFSLDAVQDLDALFGRFNKGLPLCSLTFSGSSIRGSIGPLTNSFRFFPYLMKLYLGGLNVDEHNLCCLLDSLRFVPRLMELIVWGVPVSYPHCITKVNTVDSSAQKSLKELVLSSLSLRYVLNLIKKTVWVKPASCELSCPHSYRAKVNTVDVFAHKALKKLVLTNVSLTPVAAAALGRSLPEMLALEELALQGSYRSILHAEEIEALFGGFDKTLPLSKLTFSGFSVEGCLAPLTNSFRFFPDLRDLYLGEFNGEINMNEHDLCCLLESLRFMPNLKTLRVNGTPSSQTHHGAAEVNTTAGITHRNLEQLKLDGISLTSAVAAALGRSLPEMPSLQVLELYVVAESIGQAKKMEALFGGFNKTLPLHKLILRGLEMRGCLAPLAKSFCFFPHLRQLCFGHFHVDEHDVCSLLENLKFMPNLRELSIHADHLRQGSCRVTKSHRSGYHESTDKLDLDGISLTPAVAVALGRSLSEMSFLQILKLSGKRGSILQVEEMEAMFGGFNRTVPLTTLIFSDFSVTGCLEPLTKLTKSLSFFPNLRELKLETLIMDKHDQCALLENFGFFRDLTELSVRREYWADSFNYHYHTSGLNSLFTLESHRVDKRLTLGGIRLTPATTAALGRLLPEMSSLETLELADWRGSILKAEEMKALFGGLSESETLPVNKITFSGFSIRGCLAPFTSMLHFAPNLRELNLLNLDMDGENLCSLLKAHFCTAEVNTMASITQKSLKKLRLDGISLTPTTAVALGQLLPKIMSLQELELTGVCGLSNRTLLLRKLGFSNFILVPLMKWLRLSPNLEELKLEKLNLDESDQCSLQENFRFIRNLTTLNVREKYGNSFSFHYTDRYTDTDSRALRALHVDEISLTPAVVAVLGQLLPEMLSLESLELIGVNGSPLQVEEIEMLFGGFNEALPLYNLCVLTFSGFIVTGCLAPLIRSLQFFPQLTNLTLEKLNMNEHDLRYLTASFQLFPGLLTLNLSHNPLGHAVRLLVPHIINLQKLQSLKIDETGYSEEDLNYVRDAVQQALPKLEIC